MNLETNMPINTSKSMLSAAGTPNIGRTNKRTKPITKITLPWEISLSVILV